MTNRMLISVDEEESRVALIEGRRLENLEIEGNGGEGRRGNIYKGVVHKVEQSLQAAFIDFGEEKQGFLPLSEIHESLWPKSMADKRPEIGQLLRERQELMVQVVKDEVGTKGATLTTYISLPGRYLVLMPESDKSGISRRLGDTERRRLKDTIDTIGVPDGFGVIIRTAGKEQRPAELQTDLFYLTKLYDQIEEKFKGRRGAGIIYKDRAHAVRFIRDYFTDDIDEVWCDNRGVLKEIAEFMAVLMPDAKKALRLYEGDLPLFIKFGVEDQIESVFGREVQLASGGSIVIDQTEALVAVDVNSGRVKGQDIEETALKTNLEAAAEVARQAKIRDLGGLIVVDFIDMRDRKHIKQVEQELRTAFADDKSKVKFGRISQFGLMELSRQRLRKSLAASITRRCETCDGTGLIRAPQSAALSLLRRIEEGCVRGDVKYVRATTAVSVANLLHNRRRRDLTDLEKKLDVVVEVVGHTEMPANLVALDLVVVKGGKAPPTRLYQLLDLIRNVVVRKESSPLPRPEDGLEALELDHNAIYRAIAQRNELLEATKKADDDFEFKPQEPDPKDDDAPTAKEKDRSTRRPRRERSVRPVRAGAGAGHVHSPGDTHDDDEGADAAEDTDTTSTSTASDGDAAASSDPASIATTGNAGTAFAPPARVDAETSVQAERRRSGFLNWMRRIFGGAEEPTDEQPAQIGPIGAITPARIEAERPKAAQAAKAHAHGGHAHASPPPVPRAAPPVPRTKPPPAPRDDDDDDDEGTDDTTDEQGKAAGDAPRRRRRRRRGGKERAAEATSPAGSVPAEAPASDEGRDDDDDDGGDDEDGDAPEGEAGKPTAAGRERRAGTNRRRRRRRSGPRTDGGGSGSPPPPAGD